MAKCRQCGRNIDSAFRFCPWCATAQRSKFVEFFRAHPSIDERKALRVSRYFGPERSDRHVRFSVWSGERAEAAVSLPEDEAGRLYRFLAMPGPSRPGALRRLERLIVTRLER
jgi:hypothetical protein